MFISENNLAALTGTSTAVVHGWIERKVYPSKVNDKGVVGFEMSELKDIPEVRELLDSSWETELEIYPSRIYNSIELFAGGGGLALGMEKAGFNHILLNEFDQSACNTLRVNRPEWKIIEGDVRHIDFSPLKGKIDFLSGGFPCQAFSFAGKQGGFNDVRGTLFFELARAVKEIQPKVFMGENVKGLVSHDGGKTFATICNIIDELGYVLVPPRVLKAMMYKVPQKRERIILIAIRKDLAANVEYHWPSPYHRVMTLSDAFYEGELYRDDVPSSEGAKYPPNKQKVLSLVPQGGDWRDLPEEIAKDYMGGSWFLGGGKTGMARRLSLDEPSLTLTCAPAQKQTERCHPIETRPLSVREYARIQTFPDEWIFQGNLSDQYKQIGNAVPVNLAWAIGRSVIRLLNDIEKESPSTTVDCTDEVARIIDSSSKLVVKKDKKTQTSEILKGYRQLSIFDLFNEYSESPIAVSNEYPEMDYGEKTVIRHDSGGYNALVAYIKKDDQDVFLDGKAFSYFSGKRFPAIGSFDNLKYFIPYIKGKGIRDVYKIKSIRIGSKRGLPLSDDVDDLRLRFDISYLGKLSEDYVPTNLKIWRTYSLIDLKCV